MKATEIVCSGYFEGEIHSDNWRACERKATILLSLSDPISSPFMIEEQEYRMGDSEIGTCYEHAEQRRLSYEGTNWIITGERLVGEPKGD